MEQDIESILEQNETGSNQQPTEQIDAPTPSDTVDSVSKENPQDILDIKALILQKKNLISMVEQDLALISEQENESNPDFSKEKVESDENIQVQKIAKQRINIIESQIQSILKVQTYQQILQKKCRK